MHYGYATHGDPEKFPSLVASGAIVVILYRRSRIHALFTHVSHHLTVTPSLQCHTETSSDGTPGVRQAATYEVYLWKYTTRDQKPDISISGKR
jgi:hypothetical protein